MGYRHRVGCILAGFLLDREPFFRGKDNEDQLVRIALVLGTQGLHDFLRKYGKHLRMASLQQPGCDFSMVHNAIDTYHVHNSRVPLITFAPLLLGKTRENLEEDQPPWNVLDWP